MIKPKLISYCLDWHIKNSDAFRDLLVEPLKNYADIKLVAWDGENLPNKHDPKLPLIFSMLPPPPSLLKKAEQKIVWLPMWDQAQGYDKKWWSQLPKNLKIVAFSDAIYQRAQEAGLPTLRLRYYPDPSASTATSWSNGRILFYWNRVGMVGPNFLKALCASLRVSTLIFKPDIDPRIEENKFYELPPKIGDTKVITINTVKDRSTYFKLTASANIVLAPRLTEGLGLVFLEAMSRGCAIIAHNAPTMNEYISHKKNGVLLKKDYTSKKTKLAKMVGLNIAIPERSIPYLLSDIQPWKQLSQLNYEKLGNQARLDSIRGYQDWQADKEAYAKFVMN